MADRILSVLARLALEAKTAASWICDHPLCLRRAQRRDLVLKISTCKKHT